MKKLIYLLFMFVMILSFGIVKVNAQNTSITNINYDGKFTIEGTGTGQIQIVLFNSDGKPLYLTTVLAENNKFSIELPVINGIENGDYKVKIANYNGTSVDSENIIVSSSTSTETINSKTTNPKTIDNLLIYIIVGVISLIGFISGIYLNRKKTNL